MAPLTALTHSLCSAMPSKTGGFGAFWGILSLFCPKYLRRRMGTLVAQMDVVSRLACAQNPESADEIKLCACQHSDVAIIVTIKIHSLPLYVHFKIMEDFKNERKPIHA